MPVALEQLMALILAFGTLNGRSVKLLQYRLNFMCPTPYPGMCTHANSSEG